MSLAARCLGEGRREWAHAMRVELEVAERDGRPLAFAFGCLTAAWRNMPLQEEGRFALANHALALGLLIPMAGLQFECVAGVPYLSLGGLYAMLTPGSAEEPFLIHAYSSAVPIMLGLWLLLAMGHLRLAWLLLERDWARVARIGALMVGGSATLLIFTVVLFVNDGAVALQAALLGIELSAVYGLASWHERLFPMTYSARLV
jgi:hypothetical protein